MEGETESLIYHAAAAALDRNLHSSGVSVVECSRFDIVFLAKVAIALGIEWHCVLDGGSKGQKPKARLSPVIDENELDYRVVFPYTDMETQLFYNGYRWSLSKVAPERYARLPEGVGSGESPSQDSIKFPRGKKTRAAAAVALEIEKRGPKGISAEIQSALNQVIRLAVGK